MAKIDKGPTKKDRRSPASQARHEKKMRDVADLRKVKKLNNGLGSREMRRLISPKVQQSATVHDRIRDLKERDTDEGIKLDRLRH